MSKVDDYNYEDDDANDDDDDDDDDDDLHCPLEPHVRLHLPSILRYLHIRYCRVTATKIKIPLSLRPMLIVSSHLYPFRRIEPRMVKHKSNLIYLCIYFV